MIKCGREHELTITPADTLIGNQKTTPNSAIELAAHCRSQKRRFANTCIEPATVKHDRVPVEWTYVAISLVVLKLAIGMIFSVTYRVDDSPPSAVDQPVELQWHIISDSGVLNHRNK